MRSLTRNRRRMVVGLLTGAVGLLTLGLGRFFKSSSNQEVPVIKSSFPLGLHYPTFEPFLFCAHHLDHYPPGTAQFGPATDQLRGRAIGSDFDLKDGFRMYHGDVVPGFPVHPHRGFETITAVRRGFVDHSDSLGAAGRYGGGDVQWLTAGAGIQHSEMMPLLHADRDNPTELFQIWLNLPRRNKMAAPHYTMFWAEDVPRLRMDRDRVQITVIAGAFGDVEPLAPPPESWAADPANEVIVAFVKVSAGGTFTLPRAKGVVNRALYVFGGGGDDDANADALSIGGRPVSGNTGFELDGAADLLVVANKDVEMLVLQSRPIGEPVVQHGPFVMNSREEIGRAIADYQRTNFGGWPWDRQDVVHGGQIERFAKYPDGRVERREVKT